jgi:transcriptional regulator with XRE-family HTH domain
MQATMDDATILRYLAANLSRLLADRGLSQSALSRASGEHVMTVNNILHCRHMPGAGTLHRLAEALEASVA